MMKSVLRAALLSLLVGCSESKLGKIDTGEQTTSTTPTNTTPTTTATTGTSTTSTTTSPTTTTGTTGTGTSTTSTTTGSGGLFGGPRCRLIFDGKDDYVDMGLGAWPEGNAPRTVSIWARVEGTPGNLYSFGSGSPEDRLSILFTSGIAEEFAAVNGTGILLGALVLKPNVWHHYAVTYDSETLRLFVDGIELVSTTEMPFNTSPGQLVLGVNPWKSAEFLRGELAEMRVWERALEADEVARDATAFTPDRTDLIGYWPMQEATGTTVLDESDSEAHGEILGALWADEC